MEGLRVTKIWGADPEQARQKARLTGVSAAVARPEDALEDVDAVLVIGRWGDDHFQPAMLAVERGLALFVDKPMTDDPAQAVELTRAAQRAGVPFMSASGLRYSPEIVALGASLRAMGPLRGLTFALPNHWRLYGVHAVDVMHAIFGSGVIDVTSLRDDLNDLATLRWTDGRWGVISQMRESTPGFHCTAYAAQGRVHADVSSDKQEGGFARFYVETMRVFARLLETGEWPIGAIEMVDVIRTLAAADISARERRTVELSETPSL